VLNHFRRKHHAPAAHGGRMYQRFSLSQRWQHGLLALSFTLLVLTGFPLHFAHVEWTHIFLWPFGGLTGARIVHRIAGLMMVTNWIWHLGYLLYRWKKANFTLRSWSMFPSWKDARDVVDYFKWGLGLRKDLPQWERFQFREKFDYFADIWGTIVMGTTGILLWFPVVLGNLLPDWAFGFAYIAHSYEGTLALMAILIWHFYNTHFNPDMFPMNPVWWTGTMTEEEMAREHPLEKARIDAESAGTTETK
jgi:cytochrome b subunit of formate dehydrogenase